MPCLIQVLTRLRRCLMLAWVAGCIVLPHAHAQNPEPPDNPVETTTIANPNPNNFDTDKIMSVLENPFPSNVLLAAHRGLHALENTSQTRGIPENSLASIGAAAQAGWEMIELDVKLTSDGIPILSHDKTWGREWCGTAPPSYPYWGAPYDPFTYPGVSAGNDYKNAPVAATALSNTRSFLGSTVLRDTVSLLHSSAQAGCGNIWWGEYPPTLQQALDYIRNNQIQMVVLLDIQDKATAQAAWQIVKATQNTKRKPFSSSAVFKMPAVLFPFGAQGGLTPKEQVMQLFDIPDFNTLNFIPVFNTSGVEDANQNITDTEDGGFDLSDFGLAGFGGEQKMLDWLSGFLSPIQGPQNEDVEPAGRLVAMEFNQKEFGLTAPGEKPANPTTTGILNWLWWQQDNIPTVNGSVSGMAAVPVGIFVPVGEYYGSDGVPQYFRSSDGSCCDYLTHFLYNNTDGTNAPSDGSPYDASDQRSDLSGFISKLVPLPHYIITDVPDAANAAFQSYNRNICDLETAPTDACSTGGAHPTPLVTYGGGSSPGTPVISLATVPTQLPGPQSSDTTAYQNLASITYNVTDANGTSFSASQPNDSIATYVWTDGSDAPQEWLTTADSGTGFITKLQYAIPSNYANASASATISVNALDQHQQIDGFGGAMTDSAAYELQSASDPNGAMDMLFGTDVSGAGLTIARSPMGSSDMMGNDSVDQTTIHTYEDAKGSFSVTGYPSDQRQITALLQAKQLAGNNFKLLGTPWTAPSWAKRGGSLIPSQCGTQDNEFNVNAVQDYAQYFVNYVQAYTALGLQPWMVSMQNEPENCKTGMPTTLFSPMDEYTLAKTLKPMLPSGTKLMGWDHNWNDSNFVNTIASSGSVDAIGYHCYVGTDYKNQSQSIASYVTECSGFTSPSSMNTAGNLGWEVSNLLIGPMLYGSKGSLYWSLAQDPNGNPHLNLPGGSQDPCQNCRGMLTVNSDGSVTPSQDYYFWAQFSKFVAPSAYRVDATPSVSGNLSTIAFHEGSTTVLVVLNSANHADGGSPASTEDETDRRLSLVNFQNSSTSWAVGADGYRRFINDQSTWNCLHFNGGEPGTIDEQNGSDIDRYINLQNVWAVCGANAHQMGTDSELELGAYIQSDNGAKFTLSSGGTLSSVDSTGSRTWSLPGNGNRLTLQEDGNLVLYSGTGPYTTRWSSGVQSNQNGVATSLVVRDDGSIALYNKHNDELWWYNGGTDSSTDLNSYEGKIVEWDQDSAAQKSSWLVGLDKNRRWIPDLATFQCLKNASYPDAINVTSDVLNGLPNLGNVWATCGGTQIGPQGTLENGASMTNGDFTVTLSNGRLVDTYTPSNKVVWTSGGTAGIFELKLQCNGDLQILNSSGSVSWNTNTGTSGSGCSQSWFELDGGGALTLYNSSGTAVWSNKGQID